MPVKVKCVHCGTEVFEFVNECPNCGKPVANKYAPTNVSASPWSWKSSGNRKKSPVGLIAAGAALIIVAAWVIYFIK
jgi:uncharacterized membrane protein YvbJ